MIYDMRCLKIRGIGRCECFFLPAWLFDFTEMQRASTSIDTAIQVVPIRFYLGSGSTIPPRVITVAVKFGAHQTKILAWTKYLSYTSIALPVQIAQYIIVSNCLYLAHFSSGFIGACYMFILSPLHIWAAGSICQLWKVFKSQVFLFSVFDRYAHLNLLALLLIWVVYIKLVYLNGASNVICRSMSWVRRTQYAILLAKVPQPGLTW